MLAIPSAIKTLFQTDGVLKNFRVHFPNGEYADITNENVVKESLHFTESICSQSTFRFGLAEASVIEFETVGIGNMYGMTIECGIEIDTSSLSAAQISAIQADPGDGTLVLAADSDIGFGYYRIPLGVFRVDRCPRNHGSMTHRRVTAYTATLKTATLSIPGEFLWSTVYARTNAITAAAVGAGLVPGRTLQKYVSGPGQQQAHSQPLFTGDATPKYISVADASGVPSDMFANAVICKKLSSDPYPTDVPAFIQAELPGYDPVAYDAFGVAVAAAITSAGIDATYDSAGNHVFADNEAALRHCVPWLFSPCMVYFFAPLGSILYQPIKGGELIPVVASQREFGPASPGGGISDPAAYAAFWHGSASRRIADQYTHYVCLEKKAAGNDVTVSFAGQTFTIPNPGVLSQPSGVKAFNLAAYPDQAVILRGIDAGTSTFYLQTSSSSGSLALPVYAFTGVALGDLANSELELEAAFGKSDRKGGTERFNLDNSSPISIHPGDYEEVWWDEYDVSPIGTVSTVYRDENNEEQEAEISVGAGTSVYELADNAIVAALDSNTLSDITSIIQSSFAPHLGAVAFTPVDLTTQGWPWLEAGDALEIEAEDGTTVETYALRVEMSGIQKLTMNIVSEGGEIISEV